MEHVRKYREATEEGRSLVSGNGTKIWYNKFFRKTISHINEKTPQLFMNKLASLDLSILEQSETVYTSFGMIMWNQNTEEKQNYVAWIQTAL